jgi:aldehyde:ferredoxin oxidoreductase
MGLRHSHLDNAGYSVDQNQLVKEKIGPEKLAESLLAEERWRQILSSLLFCNPSIVSLPFWILFMM